jgi:hypothetical protein
MKMKYLMLFNNMKYNKGYTLLFAVLISSVVLGIGVSILSISKKELIISTSARDSSAAFYAADSGIECAIYADLQGTFDTESGNMNPDLPCHVPYSFDTPVYGPTSDEGTFVFHMKSGSADVYDPSNPQSSLVLAGKSCVVVTVTKAIDPVTGRVKTKFDSRGYNTGWRPDSDPLLKDSKGKCDLGSVKRVERGLSYASY